MLFDIAGIVSVSARIRQIEYMMIGHRSDCGGDLMRFNHVTNGRPVWCKYGREFLYRLSCSRIILRSKNEALLSWLPKAPFLSRSTSAD